MKISGNVKWICCWRQSSKNSPSGFQFRLQWISTCVCLTVCAYLLEYLIGNYLPVTWVFCSLSLYLPSMKHSLNELFGDESLCLLDFLLCKCYMSKFLRPAITEYALLNHWNNWHKTYLKYSLRIPFMQYWHTKEPENDPHILQSQNLWGIIESPSLALLIFSCVRSLTDICPKWSYIHLFN